MAIRVFISHSADDEDLTQAFISLLEAAFHFEEREVRCTSLPGYKLRTGTHTSTQLKQELNDAELVLCILTPVSTESEWVRFELGAAWAMNEKWVVPLLAGLDYDELPGPLREVHAIRATDSQGIYQLLDEIREKLQWASRPAAKVAGAVRDLVESAEAYEELEESESPFEEFDVNEVYDLNIDNEQILTCIAVLMANIYRIYLVDGETGHDVQQSPLELFEQAFLNPEEQTTLTYEAEISNEPLEPEDIDNWRGEKTWEIDDATHYRLNAQIRSKKGTLEHIFEFTVENDDDGSRGKYIEDGQVRWTSSFQKA
jgi:hypothetical protein